MYDIYVALTESTQIYKLKLNISKSSIIENTNQFIKTCNVIDLSIPCMSMLSIQWKHFPIDFATYEQVRPNSTHFSNKIEN
jgi:hypothetical protein